ncbi:MAG: hypothetical protein LBV75_00110 [Paludibacter sp.]|jgi:hypothetical protein|nr:hypothetical protein [Paludibacter sp.]
MKKYFIYLTVCAAIFAAGCTEFEDEKQLTLPDASAVEISDIVAEEAGDSITFKVASNEGTGYYSWVVVASEVADSTIAADHILKKLVAGVASGIANYTATPDTIVGVGKLTPFTVYQIYAVAASADGIVSRVKIADIRTLDDGSKPTPQSYALADTIVTLTFHEPLRLGTGRVFVSYFAKNTLSGSKPLVVAAGKEVYNPQNVVIPTSALSVSGKALVIKLSAPPAGAYASITYEAGAVTDLEGNLSSAYSNKADTLVSGAPSRGITVHLANKAWALHGEFEDDPETVQTFAEWDDLLIPAIPDKGIAVSKKIATITPTVTYRESGKATTIDVDASSWGLLQGAPVFLLPEEPARGAVVDLAVPAGAYEDVYGNTSKALTVEGNYLYSYGYTLADIAGTWQLNGINGTTGAATAPETVIIADDATSQDPKAVLIKNLGKFITGLNSEIKATFDPVAGTLTVPDWQPLAVNYVYSASITADVLFSTYDTDEIVFAVTSSGKITSSDAVWGYYLAKGNTYYGALRWYATSSTWTRTSTATSAPAAAPAAAEVKAISSANEDLPLLPGGRKSNK